ncbi:hypothetical protein [Pseudonocardia sp. D17]|uniref:hypothetical protein n=1 Tax=Pseudonocardia sp. D17 TaxID=882661 RepID=UPI002B377E99|nr:hypothetical protein PSD17_56620 [Pseudonocardia sp. D17]
MGAVGAAGAYRDAFNGVAEYATQWAREHPRASAAELAARLTAQAAALNAIRRGRCPRCGAPAHMRFGSAQWVHSNGKRGCPS